MLWKKETAFPCFPHAPVGGTIEENAGAMVPSSPQQICPLTNEKTSFLHVVKSGDINKLLNIDNIKAWADYVMEWTAKCPYGFLTTVILALTPLFLASAVLSWKLAKMIEAKEKEQKRKQKWQENIAKAKRLKKD
ncbi:small integral membrane protein 15-like [Sorex araneus]|uniref:small integral membrane protein 15-like n=1 Tax=Sorex araneus TaxID=42254 RepID=UPI0024338B03|nr:small integral membrane protein 15-like [Sorex araneus]